MAADGQYRVPLARAISTISEALLGNWIVIVSCDGISPADGPQAAIDIGEEFNRFRSPRYVNANCSYADGILTLSCENDGWDADGRNLMDEFSDCLTAYLQEHGTGLKLILARQIGSPESRR